MPADMPSRCGDPCDTCRQYFNLSGELERTVEEKDQEIEAQATELADLQLDLQRARTETREANEAAAALETRIRTSLANVDQLLTDLSNVRDELQSLL